MPSAIVANVEFLNLKLKGENICGNENITIK